MVSGTSCWPSSSGAVSSIRSATWPARPVISVSLAVAQFGILAPLIPFGFVATVMRRPRYALLTGSAVAITCFFAASYINADINRYYLGPILIAWTWLAILAGMAAEAVTEMLGGRRRALTAALIAAVLLMPTLSAIPSRLAAVDESADHAAADWLDRVLPLIDQDAVVITWWSYSTPLWYAQRVEGRRPDIFIADDRTRLDQDLGDVPEVIDDNLGRRPVYVMRQNPSDIAALAGRYNSRTSPHRRQVCWSASSASERPHDPGRTTVVLLPGPQRGGQHRGPRRRGARDAAVARRAVRDHRGRRRLQGRHRPASPTSSRRAIRASSASSITRPTSATARPSGRASPRRATSSSPSPTAIASSRSPTSAG